MQNKKSFHLDLKPETSCIMNNFLPLHLYDTYDSSWGDIYLINPAIGLSVELPTETKDFYF